MTVKCKVLRPFPVTWRKNELLIGESFELIKIESIWREVGCGYYRANVWPTEKPDFSGARLQWLILNQYLE